MKLIVLNLPRTTTEIQLNGIFKHYGEVSSCNLVLDKITGKSKGFGFIEMPNKTEAEAAIAGLHHSKIGERTIRVKYANPDTDHNII